MRWLRNWLAARRLRREWDEEFGQYYVQWVKDRLYGLVVEYLCAPDSLTAFIAEMRIRRELNSWHA